MGIWLPRRSNIDLVREVRATWRRTQALRGRRAVRIEHVRSHTAVPGNELADKLADAGRLVGTFEADIGVDAARRVMSMATNTRDQRRPRAAPPPIQPPFTPNQPFTPLQPFTIYQTSQTPANADIRDDG